MTPTKCPPRPGGPEAGEDGRHPHHTAHSPRGNRPVDDLKVAVEVERRLLSLGWLRPIDLHDLAVQLGLKGDDFGDRLHGHIFAFLLACAELDRAPIVVKCHAMAFKDGIDCGCDELFDVLLCTDFRDGELVNYAHDVLRASQQRSHAEFRDLCRDTLRAISRGLRLDAEHPGGVRGDDPLFSHGARNGRDKHHRSPLFRVGVSR